MDKKTKQALLDKAAARSPALGTEDPKHPYWAERDTWNKAVLACINAVDEHWEERFNAGSDKVFLDGILSTRRIIDNVVRAKADGKL